MMRVCGLSSSAVPLLAAALFAAHAPAASGQSLLGPTFTGPLQAPAPVTFRAGPFGTLDLDGVLSGVGLMQSNAGAAGRASHWDLTNGQIFIQKATGWWQFYLQAGAYNLLALGAPFLSTATTVSDFYGPLPQAFLKIVPAKNFSIMAGALPTLIGAESAFSFQNAAIERGLLWVQENTVNRGIQFNETIGRVSASESWNDGFYSNRYTWITGSLSYLLSPASTLAFTGGGNLGRTRFVSRATPVQNNSRIYSMIYTYSHESWIVQPYIQFTTLPSNTASGAAQGAETRGGALLLTYNLNHHVAVSGRGEYISTTGNPNGGTDNVLFGPGSDGWSLTLTPTFQDHGFFVRGEVSLVGAINLTPGDAFGERGMNRHQARGMIEAGFIF